MKQLSGRAFVASLAATLAGFAYLAACLPLGDVARDVRRVDSGDYASSFVLAFDDRFPHPGATGSTLSIDRAGGLVEVRFRTAAGEVVETWAIASSEVR